MIRPGSRHSGAALAEHHIEAARGLNHDQALEDPDLAVFLAGTPAFQAYRRDLYWAQEYARFNRTVMLHLLQEVVRRSWPRVAMNPPISCHHNYVAEEIHFGEELLITRKGAIRAGRGQCRFVRIGVAWRRSPDEPERGTAAVHDDRSARPDEGGREPQGSWGD